MKRAVAWVVVLILAIAGIVVMSSSEPDYAWDLSGGIPPPLVPDHNPMSDAKVELGRFLFYDTRLSVNHSMSCATCHIQALAFTDGRSRSIGSTGAVHPRSSMSLVNVGYASRLTWANPMLDRLEDQALTPLLGDNPVEMGMGGREDEIGALILEIPHYKELAESAFPNDEIPYSLLNAVRAISAFVRSISSFDSPYDHYLAGDTEAMPESAVRGMDLFFSERVECFHCHGGFNFTDSTTHANTNVVPVGFHNNGLYNLGGEGAYPDDNTGLFDMTGNPRDMGRFKAPTLRNIALTAPYMHDGSFETLHDVVSHYGRGGRLIGEGAYAGDGRLSPYKSEFVVGFELTEREKNDLVEFLESLTDPTVVTDPRWSDPFAKSR